jgi:hypothetical protein
MYIVSEGDVGWIKPASFEKLSPKLKDQFCCVFIMTPCYSGAPIGVFSPLDVKDPKH